VRRTAARAVPLAAAVAAAAALAAPTASGASAPAPQRTGTTAGGVPFVLKGRTLRLTVPATTKRGRRITVRCGRVTKVDVLPSYAFNPAVIATGSAIFRKRRRLEIRLNRDVAAIAEWCDFDTKPSGRSGAAVLAPELAPRPARLVAGPGVREGATEEPGGRFLVDGSTLTLLTTRPLPADTVLFLACYAGDSGGGLLTLGARALAIGKGQRAVSADLGADVEGAMSCFAENNSTGGRDLYITYFGAAPP